MIQMKNKHLIFYILSLAFLILASNASKAQAQPSEAQLKKQITSPKTVSVMLGSPGKIEWSKTYKKYIWTRNFTAKLKTDTPGETLVVTGYAAYDVMGGRYVFWRTFTSGNNYEGKKNPTVEEINQALQTAELTEFTFGQVIGEYESMKLSAEPRWEWHTADSVSFDVIVVYNQFNRGGSYGDEPQYESKPGVSALDKIEAYRRMRIYRKGANQPWNGVAISDNVPTPESKVRTRKVERLLERRLIPDDQVSDMPKMSVIPKLMP